MDLAQVKHTGLGVSEHEETVARCITGQHSLLLTQVKQAITVVATATSIYMRLEIRRRTSLEQERQPEGGSRCRHMHRIVQRGSLRLLLDALDLSLLAAAIEMQTEGSG